MKGVFIFFCAILGTSIGAPSPKAPPTDLFQNFYPLCESDKNVKCSVPTYQADCFELRNCTLGIAMETTDVGFEFSMYANSDVEYMSLAFSKDLDMGDDPVVQCVRDAEGKVTGQLSYNVGLKNERIPDAGLNIIESAYEDGVLYCKFSLADTLKYAQRLDNYTAISYYVTGAAGPLKANGDLAVHNGLILVDEKWRFGKDLFQDFYPLCESDETVKCSVPTYQTDCFEYRNCTLGIAMETTEEGFQFSMYANSDVEYMSLAFSKDLDMGDDPVVQCVRDNSSIVTGQLSYNVGLKNERIPDDGLHVIESAYEEGVLYCKFTLADTLKYAQRLDNYTAVSYYVTGAAGPLKDNGDLAVHNGLILVEEKWKLGEHTHEEFYELCEKENVKCAGAWGKSRNEGGSSVCIQSRNCTKIFAMETVEDDENVFYMLAINDVGYMSLGFSVDDQMGEEPVVACIRNDTQVSGSLSYNAGHKNVLYETSSELKMLETKAEDDFIYCKFQISGTFAYANRITVNDTEATSFYMLGAAGVVDENGVIGHHSGSIVSDEMWQISSSSTIASSIALSFIGYLIARHL